MATKTNSVIFQKYLNLIYYTNDIVKKYPKCEIFALVKEIKNALYCGLKHLMYAMKSYKNENKLNFLNEFDINLDLLKVYIRLSYKYISMQNYTAWSELLTDICNMLEDWITSCQKQ